MSYRSEFNEWYEENLLDSAVEFMLEYEIHQNNDSECVEYLCKKLTTNTAKSAAESIETSAVSTRSSARKWDCKLKKLTD